MGAERSINAGTLNFSLPGLALEATTTKDILTTAATNYSIRGKIFTKAAFVDVTVPATDSQDGKAFPALSASQGTIVFIGLDAAGGVLAAQGDIEDLDVSDNFKSAPMFPSIVETMCVFAYMIIKADATATSFTFGLDTWNATGVTIAIVEVTSLPDRLQVA